jgi:hypothetical protein
LEKIEFRNIFLAQNGKNGRLISLLETEIKKVVREDVYHDDKIFKN